MKKLPVILMLFIVLIMPLMAHSKAVLSVNMPDTLMAGTEMKIILQIDIQRQWHINSADPGNNYSIPASIRLESATGVQLNDVQYPEGRKASTGAGEGLYLYEGSVEIPAKLFLPDKINGESLEMVFNLSYQACNDVSCLPPEESVLQIERPVVQKETEISKISENLSARQDVNNISDPVRTNITNKMPVQAGSSVSPLSEKNILIVLLTVFIMGLGLNLTPCVYPLIPITMSFFISQKNTRSPALLAVTYVVGLAVTYSVLGTLAALGGSMMGSLLAHPLTLIVFSFIMIALSLSMFGVYEFKLPDKLVQGSGGSRNGIVGALIMGLTMGIVAAPCIGPFVVSLIAYVAQSGSPFIGFITFFFLALGLGVPYLLLGIFSARIDKLPRSGEWLNGIRIFFGLALVGMAIYFVLPLMPAGIKAYLLPVYMLLAAVYYGIFDRSGMKSSWFVRVKTFISMVVLALAVLMLAPGKQSVSRAQWQSYSQQELLRADRQDKPVIIDFYADWCSPCRELDHITFSDPSVIKELSDFVRLKVDLTRNNPFNDSLKTVYGISGVPTIVFMDENGNEISDQRLNGFEKPEKFLKRIKSIK